MLLTFEEEILLSDNTDSGPLPSIDFLAGLGQLEELELLNIQLLDNRLEALFDLPRLRFLRLTGRVGPNIDELRRRRPDVEIETHLTGEPEGRVYVGAGALRRASAGHRALVDLPEPGRSTGHGDER